MDFDALAKALTEKKQDIFDQYQCGLNLMVDTVFVGLTIKSLEYMSHDLPLINNIKGDTWKNVEGEQIGFNIDDQTVEKVVSLCEENYNYYRGNTERVFHTVFDTNVINDQLYKIMEDL